MHIVRRICYRLAALLEASFATILLWMSGATANAAPYTPVYSGKGIKDGLLQISGLGGIASTMSITNLIITIINFILNIVLLLAVLAIIVAGVYLIVSNGDEGQKDKAKNIVLYAIAGIILILLARVIVVFVNNLF